MASLRHMLFLSAIALLYLFLFLSDTNMAGASAGRELKDLTNVQKNVKIQKLGKLVVDLENKETVAHFLLTQRTEPPENMLLVFDRVVKAKSWMRKGSGMKINLSIKAHRRGAVTNTTKVYNANVIAFSDPYLLTWKPKTWEE